jgi:aminopeptidase
VDYRELFKDENREIRERYDISLERIEMIPKEESVNKAYRDYFVKTASFILMISELLRKLERDELVDASLEELQVLNHQLYEDIIGVNYETSYANPMYASEKLGKDYGKILSFLYTEIRGMIVYAYEFRFLDLTIHNELFIQIYNVFESSDKPDVKEIEQILYWFISDYSDITVSYRIREQLDPKLSFAVDIIKYADLTDIRYLYRYGEYVTENEWKMAEHMNSLSQEEINRMADAYTEGYRTGFDITGKDLSKKNTVNIHFVLGFERMIRRAVENFEKMNLQPIIYRSAVNVVNRRGRRGYYGAIPNKQFDYDHKFDMALYLDGAFNKRKLDVLCVAYEEYKELAHQYAGPALVEIFGDKPFAPTRKAETFVLSKKQQKLLVDYDLEAGQIINRYIPGEERSFTIIAFPTPEIGESFPEIFDEVVKINTLDYKLYQRIQQIIINALDEGEFVEVLGRNGNKTNIVVSLHPLTDPAKQTKFENCVADVNIPVGEVFTSPKLAGTNGVLHVKQVYLNELNYEDLTITFEEGMVTEYICGNFEMKDENIKYIKENLMYHRETLPLGEFAIGTNTTAYVVANKYELGDKLPILIAEKMGPHFAIGDTCYSWSEDNAVYNPDGKEIIAKENEVSCKRREDPGAAYFGCHTDITIPYDELGSVKVVKADGSRISILENGRFVLEGTEELNKPFDK